MVTMSYVIALVFVLAKVDQSFARRIVHNEASVSSNLISNKLLQELAFINTQLFPSEGSLNRDPDGKALHGDHIGEDYARSAAAYQSCPNYMSLLRLYTLSKKKMKAQEQYVKTLKSQLNRLQNEKRRLASNYVRKCVSSIISTGRQQCQVLNNNLNRKKKEVYNFNKRIKIEEQQALKFRKQYEYGRSRLWRCTNPW